MLIHDNIKFLRLSRKMSQEKLAEALGDKLKRSNIASYEQATSPPLTVLVKMARFFGVSVDDLLTIDLSKGLTTVAGEKISRKEIIQRLDKVIKLSGKSRSDFAMSIGASEKEIEKVLSSTAINGPAIDGKLLFAICSSYPWLSLEWFVRGNGAMVIERSNQLTGMEDQSTSYIKGEQALMLELEIDRLKDRMDRLEKLVKPNKTRS